MSTVTRPAETTRPAPTGGAQQSPYLPSLPYAPGLDGIRALAVAGVVLYHARVSWLPGGFLGVDVFFVLSGYLITSLLLSEHARTGYIDLVRFWAGRARRLLPAALLVIAVCLVVVALFYPGSLDGLRIDALTSVLYVNNWHQILASHSYFASFGRPSLLMHFWSLAVEEQFYLLWPVLLAVCLARSRRHWAIAISAVVAVLSAVLMAVLYHAGSDPTRIYYGTDTRATPLMLGALLAFALPLGGGGLAGRPGPAGGVAGRPVPTAALDALGLAGLVGIVLAMHSWQDYDPSLYHGGFVIAAIAAAAAVLAAGRSGGWVSRGLSLSPLRWIGQRSYGIYLWHWPVMALTRPGIDLAWSSWILVPAQIALTLALASVSFRYLEMPIRRRVAWAAIRRWFDRLRPRQRLGALAGTTAAASAVLAVVVLMPASAASPIHLPLASAAARGPVPHATRSRHHRGARTRLPVIHGGVLAVGASVMLAAQRELEQRIGARVDAAVGRQPGTIIDRLAAYRMAGSLPPQVIVQIGDNGPVWYADIVRLRAVLRGVPRVVLVNVREPASWEGEVNTMLQQAIQNWPQATIANWRAASSSRKLLYDGAHPNPAGAVVYADVVQRALGGR